MSVVTIRGQLGSGAPDIGKLVTDKLQTDYVNREIIAKVAELLNTKTQDEIAKEMPPGSFLKRTWEALGRGLIGDTDYERTYVRTGEISSDDTRYLTGLNVIL